MNRQTIQNAVREADEEQQTGLIIWADWTQWDNYSLDIRRGNEEYEFVLSQVERGKEATVTFKEEPGFFAVSVKKLHSKEYLEKVLGACKLGYKGPIVMVPSNRLAERC